MEGGREGEGKGEGGGGKRGKVGKGFLKERTGHDLERPGLGFCLCDLG